MADLVYAYQAGQALPEQNLGPTNFTLPSILYVFVLSADVFVLSAWLFPVALLQWNWTLRIFLALEMNWQICFPDGTHGRTAAWLQSCFSDSLRPSSTVASCLLSGPVSSA